MKTSAGRIAIRLGVPLLFAAAGLAAEPPGGRAGVAAWPGFRGANLNGPALRAGDPLVTIDPAKNTIYRVAVPASGQSSPIIWGDRIYLTGEDGRVMAFDRPTGKLLWNTQLKAPAASEPEGEDKPTVGADAGWAAPTPATDGDRVVATFGDGVIGCVDRDGRQLWTKKLTPVKPNTTYGFASSPLLYGDTVFQQVDQSGEKPSFLIALSIRDGTEKWRKLRTAGSGWSSPVLAKLPEGESVVATGARMVVAYDPATGAELWRCEGLCGEIAASPIFCGGVVIAPSKYVGESPVAVRPGGKGNVSKSHIAWETDAPGPNTGSPVSDGKTCYYTSGSGLIALNPANGKQVWEVELDGTFYASPVVAAGRIYAVNRTGTMFVVSAEGRKLAESQLDAHVDASPAVLEGRIYIRTRDELWCLGERTR